jgi:hypothetical protein
MRVSGGMINEDFMLGYFLDFEFLKRQVEGVERGLLR